MNKKLNTKYLFEFEDGTTAEMTLAFYALLMLKGKNKGLYERYNRAMNKMGSKKDDFDELESLTILYVAYACANIEDFDSIMSEEDFIFACGSDRMAIGKALQALTAPKKK